MFSEVARMCPFVATVVLTITCNIHLKCYAKKIIKQKVLNLLKSLSNYFVKICAFTSLFIVAQTKHDFLNTIWLHFIFQLCFFKRYTKQACSQDLEKGGAILKEWEKCKRPWPEFSLFLSQFHTVCPKIETKFLGKLGNSKVFSAQNQVVSKNKRSSPTLSLIFCPISLIQTLEGGLFSYGGLFSIFLKKSASKAPKTRDFPYFTSQWGGLEPPPPPGYATDTKLIKIT